MKVIIKKICFYFFGACPNCDSTNIAQVADHSSHGYNGYVCSDCNCKFGN